MEQHKNNPHFSLTDIQRVELSNAEWKKILPPELYYIAREKGTEYAFTGKYNDFEGIGNYHCAACGNHLFDSDTKFSSSCGWPSFFQAARAGSMQYHEDFSHGMNRIEVLCGRCDAHLGHIFDDGPNPTGKRYCMNSISLLFIPKDK